MKKNEPMRNINPFGLRMQPDLRAQIEKAAEQSHRSLNAEIVARLETSFEVDEAIAVVAPGAPLHEAAPLLISLSEERDQAVDELRDLNLEVHAKALHKQFAYTEARLDKIESRIEYLIENKAALEQQFRQIIESRAALEQQLWQIIELLKTK